MTKQHAVCTVLATGAETGGAYAVVAVTLPPYAAGPEPHRHPRHVEGCYVVQGTLALTSDGYTTTLTSGASALIPPGVAHTFWNPTAATTTVLAVFRPGVDEAEAIALLHGNTGE